MLKCLARSRLHSDVPEHDQCHHRYKMSKWHHKMHVISNAKIHFWRFKHSALFLNWWKTGGLLGKAVSQQTRYLLFIRLFSFWQNRWKIVCRQPLIEIYFIHVFTISVTNCIKFWTFLQVHTNSCMKSYRKFPKYSDTQKICCNHPKSLTRWHFLRVMHPKDAEGIANSVGAVWSGSALFCPDLSVQKHRKITVYM